MGARAKITHEAVISAMRLAVDNMALKLDFFQKMSSDEAIALRLAEAACGSKWKQPHKTHLDEVKSKVPKYAGMFDKLGITSAMSSVEVLDHIKAQHVCDKRAKNKVFRSLDDDDPAAAIAAMA